MRTSFTNLKGLGAPFALGLGALCLMLSSLLVISPAAHASAYGCNVQSGLTGPYTYCVYISGSGTYVNYVSGEYVSSLALTNTYITAEFFDTGWHWYQTLYSSTTVPGSGKVYKQIPIYSYKRAGWMCSTLHYSYPGLGNRTMSVCHQIK